MDKYQHEEIAHDSQIPSLIAILEKEMIAQHFSSDIFIPAHWHRSIEISLIENAEVILQIGEQEHMIKDFTLINSGVVHSLKAKSLGENPSAIILILSYDYLKEIYPNIDYIHFDIHQNENNSQLKKMFYDLKNLYLNQDQYTYIEINACLLKIFTFLLRYCQSPISQTQYKITKNQYQIQMILTFIHEHYQEPLTLNDIATSFHISKEYFSRQFHFYVGKTFREYLSSYRLYKAYEDLIGTDKTIQNIARDHGFLNVKSFIHAFKETYDDTPLQYRKKRIEK